MNDERLEQLEQLDQLVMDAHAAKNHRAQRRDTLHLSLKATLLADPAQPQIRVETRELSHGGLSFVSPRHFPPGEYFSVLLKFVNKPGRLILCQSIYSRLIPGGQHHTGVKFIETITPNKQVAFPRRWIELAARGNTAQP